VWRLPDGSVVHLNSGSELRARFSDTQRVVEVQRGQAMFDVARDPQRPFRVVAGDTEVVAIGTSFDVYRRADATVVTVVTGKVAVYRNAGMVLVSPAGESTAGPAASAAAALPRPLTAGEQVRLAHAGAPAAMTAIDRVDIAKAVAWTQQQIMFDQERLADVAREFNRYGAVPIELESGSLEQLRITGIFNAYDTDSFVGFLERLEGVEVISTRTKIRVLKNSGT
jgi:transmembrane sensor